MLLNTFRYTAYSGTLSAVVPFDRIVFKLTYLCCARDSQKVLGLYLLRNNIKYCLSIVLTL